jgi:MFS family permease
MTTRTTESNSLTRELALLVIGQIFLHACMMGLRMAAPLWALRNGYSETAVGVLLSLFALGAVLLALPAGRYTDLHGVMRPVGWSVLVAVIGTGLAAAFPVFPVLCLTALLVGGASATAVIALQRRVGRAVDTPASRRRAFSWLSIGSSFSGFLGPFAAGLMIDYAGFRVAFLLLALLPLGCWMLVRRVAELPPPERASLDDRPAGAWDLLRDATILRLMMVNLVLSVAWDLHAFLVPLIGHERGLSASMIGLILGSFAIAAVVVRLLLPMVAARTEEWVMIVASMVISVLAYGLYPLTLGPITMVLCSVVLGGGLGMVQPMVLSMLHHVTPEHRHGEVLGLRMMLTNVSSAVLPLAFAAVASLMGAKGLFWLVSAISAGGAASARRLKGGKGF